MRIADRLHNYGLRKRPACRPFRRADSYCHGLRIEPLEDRRMLSLLGIAPQLQLPLITYDSTGATQYTEASDAFDINSTPLFYVDPVYGPSFVTGASSFDINISVDDTGQLIGPGTSTDLVITGNIDVDGDTVIDFSGTLLTGKILEFGYEDSGGPTDQYDFRFQLTGGVLASEYAGKDLGVTTTSEGSSFTGDFTVDFGGGAKGNVGAIEPLVSPEPDIDLEKYTRVDVNPIDIEKLVRVEGLGSDGDLLGPDGYVCAAFGKPVAMTFEYNPGSDVITEQDPSKAAILADNGADADGISFVIVTDESDAAKALAGDGKLYFEGDVAVGGTFVANEDLEDFGSTTYLHYFDDADGPLLQSAVYHTSCSQPIKLGDVIGNSTLVGYVGEDGAVEQPDYGPGIDDDDADSPTGPAATPSDTVVFTYVVTNPIPGTQLADVVVTDQVLAPDVGSVFNPDPVLGDDGYNVGDSANKGLLDHGEVWLYTSTVDITDATLPGQYLDKATVTADGAMDMDPAHYVVAPPIFEDPVCGAFGKPQEITFEYQPGTDVVTSQDPSKATATGTPDDDGESFLVVTNENDVSKVLNGEGKVFFDGTVLVGQDFTASIANAATDKFESNTLIYVFEDEAAFTAGENPLQTMEYHTSCSQPIYLGDVIGSVILVGYVGETGSAELPDPPVDPGLPDLGLDGPIFQVDDPFDPGNIGVDADGPTGPLAQPGDKVTHTYVVTNTGDVSLTITSLFDDNETDETPNLPGEGVDDFEPVPVLKANGKNFGDANDNDLLDLEEVWYYQVMRMAIEPGQHTDVAKVIAEDAAGEMVMADDPSNYLVDPLEFEKYVFVPTDLPDQYVCQLGKAVAMTFEYVPGTTVDTEQDPSKAAIVFDSGSIDDDGTSFIIVTDESDATKALAGDGKQYFAGDVEFDDLFEANEDIADFGSTTYIHFFDDSDPNLVGTQGLLQTVVYHTSCSQPIRLGDVIGSATLVEYDGEDGSASLVPTTGLGDPADSPTGPFFVLGDEVVFNYVLTNTSEGAFAIDLTNVVISDSELGPITEFVDNGNGDSVLDPGETWILTGSQIATEEGQQMNLGTVTSDQGVGAEDPANHFVEVLKFHVVDNQADADFRYTRSGKAEVSTALNNGNSEPRGVASDPTGNMVWVVDKDKHVYVYDYQATNFLGEWKAKDVGDPQGIATDAEDIWILEKNKVVFYDGGASFAFGQEHNRTSVFDLAQDNDHAKGITTDGTHLWVVDDDGGTDKVFKYTVDGTLVSSWTLDSANEKPRGITIDPTGASDTIWVVDQEALKVFTYEDAKKDAGGTLSGTFRLAAANEKPEGIADPDASFTWTASTESQTVSVGSRLSSGLRTSELHDVGVRLSAFESQMSSRPRSFAFESIVESDLARKYSMDWTDEVGAPLFPSVSSPRANSTPRQAAVDSVLEDISLDDLDWLDTSQTDGDEDPGADEAIDELLSEPSGVRVRQLS